MRIFVWEMSHVRLVPWRTARRFELRSNAPTHVAVKLRHEWGTRSAWRFAGRHFLLLKISGLRRCTLPSFNNHSKER